MHKHLTPALSAFAAGQAPTPLGYRLDGRPIFAIAGGAEDANPAGEANALPSAEELAGLSAEDLDAVESRLEEEAEALRERDDSDLTDPEIERMVALADALDAVDADRGRRETEAQERAQRAQEARERLAREQDSETDPEADPEPDAEPEGEPAGDEGTEDAPVEQSEAVAAGASRRAPRPARRRQPKPASAGSSRFSLVAAADVGGNFTSGQTLESMSQVAEAFIQRSKSFPQGTAYTKGVRHQHQVAQVRRNHAADPDGLYIGNGDFASDQEVFQAAARESRLSGGSLVAAGGWCAPSETLYGIKAMETMDGLIDLPTVGVDRGGINYTPGPDFSDIYTSAGFSQTEAEAIAGTEKACVEVDCPDFSEVRLDAVGYCVKAPLLTRTAYPEVIQRWLEGTMVANAHKVAARLISSMRTALGTALAPTLTGTPVTWGTLSIIEWVIEMQRQAYRLSDSETLEVVAPRWLRAAIRADLANRMGIGKESVSNGDIAQHFSDRGAAVQWVLNYLEVGTPLTSVAYPATAEVMVYPAGTFVRGNADVIQLDTVYDTADLQTNVYTAAFVEDGVLLAKMQHGGARITIPVNVNGMLGSAQLDDNLFTAQAESVGA